MVVTESFHRGIQVAVREGIREQRRRAVPHRSVDRRAAMPAERRGSYAGQAGAQHLGSGHGQFGRTIPGAAVARVGNGCRIVANPCASGHELDAIRVELVSNHGARNVLDLDRRAFGHQRSVHGLNDPRPGRPDVNLHLVIALAGLRLAIAQANRAVMIVLSAADTHVIRAGLARRELQIRIQAVAFARRRVVVAQSDFLPQRVEQSNDRIESATQFVGVDIDRYAIVDIEVDLVEIDVHRPVERRIETVADRGVGHIHFRILGAPLIRRDGLENRVVRFVHPAAGEEGLSSVVAIDRIVDDPAKGLGSLRERHLPRGGEQSGTGVQHRHVLEVQRRPRTGDHIAVRAADALGRANNLRRSIGDQNAAVHRIANRQHHFSLTVTGTTRTEQRRITTRPTVEDRNIARAPTVAGLLAAAAGAVGSRDVFELEGNTGAVRTERKRGTVANAVARRHAGDRGQRYDFERRFVAAEMDAAESFAGEHVVFDRHARREAARRVVVYCQQLPNRTGAGL